MENTIVSDQEQIASQKYGGFPNNKDFNNDTKCNAVLNLFAIPGIGPKHPLMAAFLGYSRVKLMELDLGWPIIYQKQSIVDDLPPRMWLALPALYRNFCKDHPGETLEFAGDAVYRAARAVAAQQNGRED